MKSMNSLMNFRTLVYTLAVTAVLVACKKEYDAPPVRTIPDTVHQQATVVVSMGFEKVFTFSMILVQHHNGLILRDDTDDLGSAFIQLQLLGPLDSHLLIQSTQFEGILIVR